MKLIYLIDSLVAAGAEHSLLALAPHYLEAGIDLEVAYLHDRPGLQAEFEALGVPLHCLDGPGARLGWTRRARSLIAARKPDLVHTTLYDADLVGRVAAGIGRRPVVSSLVNAAYGPEHFGDPKLSSVKLRLAQAADALTARAVHRFHAISEHVADVMAARLFIDRSRIDVIPRGRDPEMLGPRTPERRSRVRSKLGVDPGTPLLLSAARHEYQKGLGVAIEAFAAIADSVPDARFLIAGREGNITSELQEAVERGRLSDRVRFLGPRDDVPDLMAAADVFILPSLWEGLSGTAIEALGMRVPLIASDLPPIREVVGTDGAALLLTPGDSAALAEAVLDTIRRPQQAAERSERGYRRFDEFFTIGSVARQMVQFYERAASQHVRTAPTSSAGPESRSAGQPPDRQRRPAAPMRPLEKMPEARPLRLLYIIDSLVPGGAEQSLSVLAPHYRDLGVELTVGFLADRPGLHLELERAGAQLVNLAGAGGRVGNVARVARVLADCKPDLVHTTLFEADIAGRVASALRGAPVVSTLPSAMYDWEHVHDPSLKPWRVRVAQVADMSTASWVRRFHAVSGHVATLMAGRLRIPQSRIDVIPRGRDPRAFGNRSSDRRAEARRRLGIDDDELMVFAAARQEHKKGLDVLLRSFPHVAESLPSARLVLAGRPGMQTPLLKRLSSELDLSSVMNLGPRRDVPDLLCAADVFVMPSVSEGFPGTLLEAMALEAPIVATDLPGIREVLGSNVIATLVPPRDPDALGRAIVRTLEDPVASGERAALARQRFLENFTVHRVAERMVGFYRRALQEA